MSVGKNIRFYRKKNGITQKRLAEMTSLNEVTIRGYEAEKYKPKIENLQKIADALCTPLETLDENFRNVGNILESAKTRNSLEKLQKKNKGYENEVFQETLQMAISDFDEEIAEKQLFIDEESDWFTSIKNVYENLEHEPKRTLVNIVQWFDELNEDGRIALLEQMELLRKIPDYKNSPTE